MSLCVMNLLFCRIFLLFSNSMFSILGVGVNWGLELWSVPFRGNNLGGKSGDFIGGNGTFLMIG